MFANLLPRQAYLGPCSPCIPPVSVNEDKYDAPKPDRRESKYQAECDPYQLADHPEWPASDLLPPDEERTEYSERIPDVPYEVDHDLVDLPLRSAVGSPPIEYSIGKPPLDSVARLKKYVAVTIH